MAKQASSWNPEVYDSFKNLRSKPFFDLMKMIQTNNEISIKKVVDLGCGTGELTQQLHLYLKPESTLGIDNSESMLKGSEKFQGNGLTFELGNIQDNLKDKHDVILSNAAFQWCKNHHELFSRLRNSLNDGGQLAVQMPVNYDYPTHTVARDMSFEEKWSRLLKNEHFDPREDILEPSEYSSLLYSLGFEQQDVCVRVYGQEMNSREDVLQWVRGTTLTHFMSRLSEVDYKQFEEEYKQRLFSALPDTKPFFFPFKRIFIWGKLKT